MKLVRTIGRVAFAFVLAIAVAYGSPAKAGSSIMTDFSDLWWLHTESGWGVQLIHQQTTIFATLFVYGPDRQPAWYTATLSYQANRPEGLTWTGTVFRTTGPWFGAAGFDPATVTVTEVGSMSLVAKFINSATLTYTVDGVQVTKTIERQTLVNERYAGRFSALFERKGTGSACGASVTATPATVEITQDTGVTNPETRFVVASSGDTCTFIGTYSQLGRFGRVSGNYSCSAGDAGTFAFLEMTRSVSDFRARTAMMTQSGCRLDGYLIGLQQ